MTPHARGIPPRLGHQFFRCSRPWQMCVCDVLYHDWWIILSWNAGVIYLLLVCACGYIRWKFLVVVFLMIEIEFVIEFYLYYIRVLILSKDTAWKFYLLINNDHMAICTLESEELRCNGLTSALLWFIGFQFLFLESSLYKKRACV